MRPKAEKFFLSLLSFFYFATGKTIHKHCQYINRTKERQVFEWNGKMEKFDEIMVEESVRLW